MARVCCFIRTVTSQHISAACDGLVYKQNLTAGWRVILMHPTDPCARFDFRTEQSIRLQRAEHTAIVSNTDIKNQNETEEKVQNRSHPFCDTRLQAHF